MFDKIKIWLKGVWTKMFAANNIEKALGVEIDTNTIMNRSIELWANLYQNKAPWLSETVRSLNLPSSIANEIARLVTLEMQMNVTGSARADFLNMQCQKVVDNLRTFVEYACAKGGLMFKPYVDGDKINVECVQADYFYPIKYGTDGTITAVAFVEQKQVGDTVYTRLEYHDFIYNMEYITNKAYKSKSKDSLGTEIQLTEVEEWGDLLPSACITDIVRPTFSYFKMPMANNIDTYSPLGVSVYARAVDLIKEADKQYSRCLWEYDSAERAVDIDISVFKRDAYGQPILPKGKERLFRTLDAEGGDSKTFYESYSPNVRDESFQSGLNKLLKRIEFNCGLAYGTLSDVEIEAKTATEVKQAKQRSYSTVRDIQKALEVSLEHLVYIMDVYTTLYNLAPKGEYKTAYKWDDSIVVDSEVARLQDKEDVRDGILSKAEFRAKWYGEDMETAKKAILAVSSETMSDNEILGFNEE